MKTKIYLLMTVTIFTATTVFAQTDVKAAKKDNAKKFDNKMQEDAEFAAKAAEAGMYEVQVATLAQANATNTQVKQLANNMVTEHSKANAELKDLAAKKNITLPTALSDKRQKDIDDLKKLTGGEFDRAFAKKMVSDHKDDIDLFEKEADKGNDPEIKAWASSKIPVLKHHLSMAESAVDALKETAKK